ncbi:Acyltransferase [Minicystis rosea]|nr:Acyltransferase [Minicystis rosea]
MQGSASGEAMGQEAPRGEAARGGRHKIAPLTGVRAVAATWVVLFHLHYFVSSAFPTFPEVVERFAAAGYLGVDLFFLLSGFVLSYQYLDAFRALSLRPYARFLALRLARIYPVHLFTLMLALGILVVGRARGLAPADPATHSAGAFVANVLLVHAWGVVDQLTWNVPSWSISCEWLAYLAFPILALRLRRIRSRLAAAALVIFGLGFAVVGLRLYGVPSLDANVHGGPVRIAGEFVAGCALFLFHREVQGSAAGARTAAFATAFAVLGIVALIMVRRADPFALIFFAVLIVALALSPHGLAKPLSAPLVIFFGEASYSLYMTHVIVLRVLKVVFPMSRFAERSLAVRAGVLGGYLALIFAAAALTYVAVERPAREWLRRRIDGR